jgi:putative DNA-invertase from lambdoid prophage Rac
VTRFAIYCRVSTDDQNCDRQRRDLLAWLERQSGELIAIECENASGASKERPGRAKLIGMAQRRLFDAIAITELSRWSRSTSDLLDTLTTLSAYGVRLCALNGVNFDTETALGKLMLTVLGAVAEFERSLIVDRTKSGLAAAKARGVKLGRHSGDNYRVRSIRPLIEAMRLEPVKPSLRLMAKRCGASVNTVRKAIDSLDSVTRDTQTKPCRYVPGTEGVLPPLGEGSTARRAPRHI